MNVGVGSKGGEGGAGGDAGKSQGLVVGGDGFGAKGGGLSGKEVGAGSVGKGEAGMGSEGGGGVIPEGSGLGLFGQFGLLELSIGQDISNC